MSLILPAFSSPDLKAFPLHLRHCRSSGSAPSLSNLPRAGRCLACFPPSCQQPLSRQLTSRRSQDRRDCVIYSVLHPLHSINPTDSPDSRISVGALVVLSVSLYLSRKDPYLPLHPQCVRLLPRTHVLACSRFQKQFAIRLRGRQITSSTVERRERLPLGWWWVFVRHLPPEVGFGCISVVC